MILKKCRILVTPTSFARYDPALRAALENQVGEVAYNELGRPLTAEELRAQIGPFDGLIAGLDEINASVIEAAGRLKVIARYGVGVDNVDLEAARRRGIVVTHTPGANAGSVAELTIALMLCLLRAIPEAIQAARQGQWPRLSGTSLEGKRIGLLGFGSIGKQVARRLSGFGAHVLAHDIDPDQQAASRMDIKLMQLEELLPLADILSLHLPLTEETRGMVSTSFLHRMKCGAYLINTARGELLDEIALLAALEEGKLAGAALDVFARQPPDPQNPLISHPNVITTPHMGAHTDAAANAMGWSALGDCLAVLQGEEPRHRVV